MSPPKPILVRRRTASHGSSRSVHFSMTPPEVAFIPPGLDTWSNCEPVHHPTDSECADAMKRSSTGSTTEPAQSKYNKDEVRRSLPKTFNKFLNMGNQETGTRLPPFDGSGRPLQRTLDEAPFSSEPSNQGEHKFPKKMHFRRPGLNSNVDAGKGSSVESQFSPSSLPLKRMNPDRPQAPRAATTPYNFPRSLVARLAQTLAAHQGIQSEPEEGDMGYRQVSSFSSMQLSSLPTSRDSPYQASQCAPAAADFLPAAAYVNTHESLRRRLTDSSDFVSSERISSMEVADNQYSRSPGGPPSSAKLVYNLKKRGKKVKGKVDAKIDEEKEKETRRSPS
ncbi:hypothetical protein K469DRAFT_698022 [Zopfia rhizophila CBS 207.26]|uniref:Uncharacterized protein n=1 Tax=Zopfia rhizophila CBS 207.26 TaxID=1314779 RepID=A0A6A6EH17_9PEZI|nr:hypothetical protein K469DRAFT_698022 [Zopfia rhizophila CBS 207.26]